MQRKLNKEKANTQNFMPVTPDPFPNMVYSSLVLVPKKESGEFRLIHDLSFPKTNSVNSHILSRLTIVVFKMLDYSVEQLAKLRNDAFIAKADLRESFRIIPVSPLIIDSLVSNFRD